MGSDWEVYPISDFVTVSQGLAINSKTKSLLQNSGLPLLRITDLINNTHVQYINELKVPEKCIARKNELIFTRTGQVGLVFKDRVGVVHNNCFKVIPNDLLDRDYLYWFLFQKSTRAYVNSIASGSVQKDLNHAAFFTLKIPKPNSLTQKAIAHILGSLDDKIELNRQMNETLESMAQALFKSWFVDFDPVIDNALAMGNAIPDVFAERAEQRNPSPPASLPEVEGSKNNPPLPSGEGLGVRELFPSEFEYTEEMGWIPKGWEVSSLEDIATISSSKRIFAKEYEVHGVPFYRGKEITLLSKGSNLTPEIFITEVHYRTLYLLHKSLF